MNSSTKGRLKLPAMASLWYILSSAISRGIGFLGTPLFTRLLSPEEYGIYPLYGTWQGLLSVIITLDIGGGAIYRALQSHSERKNEVVSTALGLITASFVLFCALYFAFFGFLSRFIHLGRIDMLMMFLQIYFSAVIGLYLGRARYEYRYRTVAAVNIILSLLVPSVSVLLIIGAGLGGRGRIYGALFATAAVAFPILFKIYDGRMRIFDKEIWLQLLKISLPLIPHYLASSLILRIGEIAVGQLHGSEALAKYSVALSLGLALNVVSNALISALSPWIIRKLKAGRLAEIRSTVPLLAKIISLLCLLILAFAPEAIAILTPPEFHDALIAVYPLELSVIPMFISGLLVSGELYFERSALSSLPSILSAALVAILSLTLLPRLDYRSASLFVLLGYVLLASLNSLLFKRLSGSLPFSVRELLSIALFTTVYAFLSFLLRDVFLSRVILAVPILLLLFTLGRSGLKQVREIS